MHCSIPLLKIRVKIEFRAAMPLYVYHVLLKFHVTILYGDGLYSFEENLRVGYHVKHTNLMYIQ